MISGKVTGIAETIKHLERTKRNLGIKVHDFLDRLGQEGYKVANAKFANALYAGLNDVQVSLKWETDTELHLIAEGEAVLFIEFGTGTLYENYPGELPDGVVEHGKYGKGKGAKPPWIYKGEPGNAGQIIYHKMDGHIVRTFGNPPARAMFDAGQEMRNRIAEIAREVFSK